MEQEHRATLLILEGPHGMGKTTLYEYLQSTQWPRADAYVAESFLDEVAYARTHGLDPQGLIVGMHWITGWTQRMLQAVDNGDGDGRTPRLIVADRCPLSTSIYQTDPEAGRHLRQLWDASRRELEANGIRVRIVCMFATTPDHIWDRVLARATASESRTGLHETERAQLDRIHARYAGIMDQFDRVIWKGDGAHDGGAEVATREAAHALELYVRTLVA